MHFGTVQSLSTPSYFQVQCTHGFKYHKSRAIWSVFCFPDVYSYGSGVLHVLDKRQHYIARGTALHILDVARVVPENFAICGKCVTLLTLVSPSRPSLPFVQREANHTETAFFSVIFAFCTWSRAYHHVFRFRAMYAEECNMAYSARGESVRILDKLHLCVMEKSFLVHNA